MFRRRALRRRLAKAGAPPVPDEQLRRLARALDAGAGGAECVPADRAAALLRLAVVRAVRFPELRDLAELRRLPLCPDQHCCNPYHWSRLAQPETPPPPYSKFAMEGCKPKEHGENTEDARRTNHERLPTGSLATDGEERPSWESEWCRLAYWELTQRVGRQFGVRMKSVDVFGGDGGRCGSGRHGLCLDALDQSTNTPQAEQARLITMDHRNYEYLKPKHGIKKRRGILDKSLGLKELYVKFKKQVCDQRVEICPYNSQLEQVRKIRAKIGLGVTLSRESDGVWLYNRSQEPVFVSSPALDAAAAKALLVWRVAPGHCLLIFDPAMPLPVTSLPHVGPVDPRSVRISFAKGWGPKYSRRDVTACPCWLEVLLAPAS